MIELETKLHISSKSVVVIILFTLLTSCPVNVWIPFCFIISAASQTFSSGPIMVKEADITSDRGVKRALFFDAIFFTKSLSVNIPEGVLSFVIIIQPTLASSIIQAASLTVIEESIEMTFVFITSFTNVCAIELFLHLLI